MNFSWLQNLSSREQWIVGTGSLCLCLFVLYLSIGVPLQERERAARLRHERGVETASFIAQLAARGGDLVQRDTAAALDNDALFSVINSSARQRGIHDFVRRITPQADGAVSVTLSGVGFDALLGWLVGLQTESAVAIRQLSVNTTQDDGRVEASVDLYVR